MSRFLCRELEDAAHASRLPNGREVDEVLIFGQQVQAVLEGIFAGGDREFVNKTFQREPGLQRVDRAHPAKRHRCLSHHVLDQVICNSVDRTRLIGEIGVDAVGNRLALLPADRRRNDAMRQPCGKARAIQRSTELMQTGGTIRGETHVVFARPHHLHRSADRF